MADIKLGYGIGIKATLLTPAGAVCDLRDALYVNAVLTLPNGSTMYAQDIAVDRVTNAIYVRLLADRELTAEGNYRILFNVKLADGVMYSTVAVNFANVTTDANADYKELSLSFSLDVTDYPQNVERTGASPKVSSRQTWLVYNDEAKAYEDTGIAAEVNLGDYYTKEEADSKFAHIIADVDNKIDKTSAETYFKQVDDAIEEQQQEIAEFKEAVTDQVENYKPIVINGDVANAADEEDITAENGLLKLANRSAINGMGYVILRKDKTFAEQVTLANTIYEIRYDFDLDGGEVTIPYGCVLDFQGGSLSNGNLNGNSTCIQGNTLYIFDSINILGDWNIRRISSDIFKTLQGENAIKNVFNLSNSNITNEITIENNGYDYLVTSDSSINITSNSDIEINGNIKIVPNSSSSYALFSSVNASNISIYGCGRLIGDRDEHSYIGDTTHEWGYGFRFIGDIENIRISGLFFKDFTGGAIRFNDAASNIKLENITVERNRTSALVFTGGIDGLVVRNCNFKDVGINTQYSNYTPPGSCIGIEPNYHIGLDNINIENCKFTNCRLPIYITNNYEMGGSYSVKNCTISGGDLKEAAILFGNMKFINIENCNIIDRSGFALTCNKDYYKLNIKNNYISGECGILYYYTAPQGFSNIENNCFISSAGYAFKDLKNCNFINNTLTTNGAFTQNSTPTTINFINNKIEGLFCYNGSIMTLKDSLIVDNTFILPTHQNAILLSGENIKIKGNNFITAQEYETSRAALYLTEASNVVISENLFSTKINSMNYYLMTNNCNNIYLLNNIFSSKQIDNRYISGDGIVFIKDGEYPIAGTTDSRPAIPNAKRIFGYQYFDTTLGMPIWWTGTKWVDASSAEI